MSGIIGVSPDMKSGVVGRFPGKRSADGTPANYLYGGHVLQVVTKTQSVEINYGGDSWVTCFQIDITPEFSDSLMIVSVNAGGLVMNNTNEVYSLMTGTTNGTIHYNTRYGYMQDTVWSPMPHAFMAFDKPGTTTAQTYTLSMRTYVSGQAAADARFSGTGTKPQQMMVMEVAG
jgi:hypothetical protein